MKLIGFFTIAQKHLNSCNVLPTWYLHPMLYRHTCSNSFINFLFAVTLSTISSLSTTRFQTTRSSCTSRHVYCSSCDVIVFRCFDMLRKSDYIYKYWLSIHQSFVSHISFQNVVWRVAGTHYKYILVSRKRHLQKGRFSQWKYPREQTEFLSAKRVTSNKMR